MIKLNPEYIQQRARTALVCVLLLLTMVGCRTKESSTPEEIAPILNTHPKQTVRIFGRIPASLEVKLEAYYTITNEQKPCAPRLVANFIAPDFESYSRTEALKLQRNGDRFEAVFAVDKYRPGLCEWRFEAITSSITKDGNRLDIESFEPAIIEIDNGEKLSSCSDYEREYCSEAMNSDPTPAVVRCELFVSDDPDKQPSLLCQGTEKRVYKRTNLVTPKTREVEVNFYDLTLDEDPISSHSKE